MNINVEIIAHVTSYVIHDAKCEKCLGNCVPKGGGREGEKKQSVSSLPLKAGFRVCLPRIGKCGRFCIFYFVLFFIYALIKRAFWTALWRSVALDLVNIFQNRTNKLTSFAPIVTADGIYSTNTKARFISRPRSKKPRDTGGGLSEHTSSG